jgi:hypothetical protein
MHIMCTAYNINATICCIYESWVVCHDSSLNCQDKHLFYYKQILLVLDETSSIL